MPDPTDPRAVAENVWLGYDPDCPECKGTGQLDSGGTHPWGEPAMMMCDCDAPPRAVADESIAEMRIAINRVPLDPALAAEIASEVTQFLDGAAQAPTVADDPSGIVQQMPEVVILPDPKRDLNELADLRAEVERRPGVSKAAQDVMAERQRQISVEGWSPEHDDQYVHDDLPRAAACYALSAAGYRGDDRAHVRFWPWLDSWWKPTTPRRDLVKAGALILAEIERLDRAALSPETDGGQ